MARLRPLTPDATGSDTAEILSRFRLVCWQHSIDRKKRGIQSNRQKHKHDRDDDRDFTSMELVSSRITSLAPHLIEAQWRV